MRGQGRNSNVRKSSAFAFMVSLLLVLAGKSYAASQDDFSTLKKDVEDLRKKLAAKNVDTKKAGPIGKADATIANKYGPNAKVTTKDGKLTVSGLVQVWWYSIQNDNVDYEGDIPASGNEFADNDSYRVRRAELKFSLDITKDITAVIMIDPTGGDEGNSFPGIPTNQSVVGRSFLSGGPDIDQEDLANQPRGKLRNSFVLKRFVNNGLMKSNRLLQDAYINYHTPNIPHHDFTLGQFKPPMSEEGNRSSGQLDFIERAMINQFSNQRDMGIMVHGSWWNDRFQYWIAGMNAAGSFQQTFASQQNRSDDNDAKDLAWKILLRPLWNDETWGSIELGYSRQDGVHGEAGRGFSLTFPVYDVDGLGLQETHANRQYAWLWYRPGGPVRGWWLRGEWGAIKDRALPGNVGSMIQLQTMPHAFRRQGWYFGTGYKLSDSVWADGLKNGGFIKKALHDIEFAFRYEIFGNLITDDVVRPSIRTDVFNTQVYTGGINYYWKGYNVRTQLNYMWVDEDQGHHSIFTSIPPATALLRLITYQMN